MRASFTPFAHLTRSRFICPVSSSGVLPIGGPAPVARDVQPLHTCQVLEQLGRQVHYGARSRQSAVDLSRALLRTAIGSLMLRTGATDRRRRDSALRTRNRIGFAGSVCACASGTIPVSTSAAFQRKASSRDLLACTKSKGRLRAPCCCPGDRPLGRFRLLLFLLRILARAREAVHARAMA